MRRSPRTRGALVPRRVQRGHGQGTFPSRLRTGRSVRSGARAGRGTPPGLAPRRRARSAGGLRKDPGNGTPRHVGRMLRRRSAQVPSNAGGPSGGSRDRPRRRDLRLLRVVFARSVPPGRRLPAKRPEGRAHLAFLRALGASAFRCLVRDLRRLLPRRLFAGSGPTRRAHGHRPSGMDPPRRPQGLSAQAPQPLRGAGRRRIDRLALALPGLRTAPARLLGTPAWKPRLPGGATKDGALALSPALLPVLPWTIPEIARATLPPAAAPLEPSERP
jgi:hypothetical protein